MPSFTYYGSGHILGGAYMNLPAELCVACSGGIHTGVAAPAATQITIAPDSALCPSPLNPSGVSALEQHSSSCGQPGL